MSVRRYAKLICLAGAGLLFALSQRLTQVEAQNLSQQAYAVLKKNCLGCHGAAKTSGLDLRTAEGVLAGEAAGCRGAILLPSASASARAAQKEGGKAGRGAAEILAALAAQS